MAIAALVCYLVVRGQLRGEVDSELRAQAAAIEHGDFHSLGQQLPGLPASAGGPAPYVQIVLADGHAYPRQGGLTLPAGNRAAAVASGTAAPYMTDLRIGDTHLREYVVPVPAQLAGEQVAVQLARPLNGVDRILGHLRLILLLLFAGGIGLAVVLGRMAAARVLSPLAEVAQAVGADRRDRRPLAPPRGSTPTTRSASSPPGSTTCSSGSRPRAARSTSRSGPSASSSPTPRTSCARR